MPRLLHPNAAHVADTLIARGHHGVIVTQPAPTRSALEAAEALGADPGAIVKSLIFLLDDEPVLLLVSGSHEVDLAATGARLQGTLTRAPLDLAQEVTGQPIVVWRAGTSHQPADISRLRARRPPGTVGGRRASRHGLPQHVSRTSAGHGRSGVDMD